MARTKPLGESVESRPKHESSDIKPRNKEVAGWIPSMEPE
jgi:hypothetical protein